MAYETESYDYVEGRLLKVGNVLKKVQIVLAVIVAVFGIIAAAQERDLRGEFSFLLFLNTLIVYAVATVILIALAYLDDIVFRTVADMHYYLRTTNETVRAYVRKQEKETESKAVQPGKPDNVRSQSDTKIRF